MNGSRSFAALRMTEHTRGTLMPLYEYVCEDCKRKTEVLQRLREKPLKICPHCGGKLKKSFSAPAIQFKGSGFYITDYARSKGDEGSKKAGGETAEGAAKSEKVEGAAKPEKAEKTEKAEKADKAEKAEKADRAEKKKKAE